MKLNSRCVQYCLTCYKIAYRKHVLQIHAFGFKMIVHTPSKQYIHHFDDAQDLKLVLNRFATSSYFKRIIIKRCYKAPQEVRFAANYCIVANFQFEFLISKLHHSYFSIEYTSNKSSLISAYNKKQIQN